MTDSELQASPPIEDPTAHDSLIALHLGLSEDVPTAPPAGTVTDLPSLWGDSPSIIRLTEMIERVAPTRANVLIVGESGAGKEVIAQHLHVRSKLADKPFVAINCSAIPANLIEAELFGHEKGSFTGAFRSRRGVFERATGGTLFLDEVTEMSLDMQVKLLRVLETGQFRRVGGDLELSTDCRIIAATNRNPEQAVAEGTFRSDLLYRLAVFPLRVPPLRERGADLELLAQRFLDELNAEYRQTKHLSAEFREFLYQHAWPGNVRELKNTLHRAYILADTELHPCAAEVSLDSLSTTIDQVAVPVGTSIAEMERKLIEATLARCAGNKRQAAQVLGVSLKTLYNRLNDYERFSRTFGQCAA